MGNRIYALGTGLFVLVFTATIIGVAWWLTGDKQERTTYLLHTTGSVSGLSESADVFFRGIPAGDVRQIRLNRDDPQEILVEVAVAKDIPITESTVARLSASGLTGRSQIVLKNSTGDAKPLATTADRPGRIPLQPGLLDELGESGRDLVDNLNELSTRFSKLLKKENRRHVEQTLANLERATGKLEEIQAEAATALEDVPQLIEQADTTLEEIGSAAADVRTLTSDAREAMASIDGFARSGEGLADQVRTGTLPRVHQLLEELEATSSELQNLGRRLNDEPQSLLRGRTSRAPGPGESGYEED